MSSIIFFHKSTQSVQTGACGSINFNFVRTTLNDFLLIIVVYVLQTGAGNKDVSLLYKLFV